MKSAILVVSLLLNIGLAYFLLATALDGCAEMSDGRIGVLKQDVEVGVFNSNEAALFTLPKGLVVREASASGAGRFEPYRFRIVVTANNERFVDYEFGDETSEGHNGEFYSVEISNAQ